MSAVESLFHDRTREDCLLLTLRLLEETDAEEFLRLRLEVLQTDPAAFGMSWEEESTQTAESIRGRLSAVPEGNFLIGAFNQNHLVGIAGFIRHKELKARHKGFIWGVYVTRSERGKGIARRVLLSLLERVHGYGNVEQIALSVSVPQEKAHQLYASLGFEVYGYERHALKIGEDYVDEEHRMLLL